MNHVSHLRLFFLLCSLSLLAVASHGQETAPQLPFLSPLFSDNAVLQRERPVPIWGWTAPDTTVAIELGDKKITARADATGKWLTKLPAQPAGGPFNVNVNGIGATEHVALKNVMFGDVWLCSGQSNMEWRVDQSNNAKEEIAAADCPNIRLLAVPNVSALTPQSTFAGAWQICSPKSVPSFSAVGYFFGRKLHLDTAVPIGLIDSTWGGTNAESWVSAGALSTMPAFEKRVAEIKAHADGSDLFEQRMAAWWTDNDPGTKANWNLPETPDADWKTWAVPRLFDYPDGPYPQFDGTVWFRRDIELPPTWAGRDLKLNFGPVDDRETTFWNGEAIGATNVHDIPRAYTVPGRLVKAGRNLIAVRVLDRGGGGGFGGEPAQMNLKGPDEAPISLAGVWRVQSSAALDKMTPAPPQFRGFHNAVTGLFNGMIAPLSPAAIKGAIWYQGENNQGRGVEYQTLLPTLIGDWRSHFSSGDFPFYIVQLANFEAQDEQPRETGWTGIQEAQLLVSQKVPNTGLAVINDIGGVDIHPTNKQDVGTRLALLALAKDYGKKVEFSGPTLKSFTVAGGSIVLKLDHAGGGLTLRGDAKRVFSVAGDDKKFVWANAVINGDAITLSSPDVAAPVAARFAWSNNPRATLHNGDGLPAALFRTDNW